jgi:hypothetical protein
MGFWLFKTASSQEWEFYPFQMGPDKWLSATEFQEDTDLAGNSYGHRDGFNRDGDIYIPNPRIYGCLYEGLDKPGWSDATTKIEITWWIVLHFKGSIVPTDDPTGPPLAVSLWTVELMTPW